jgi:argininosuccinate lyase
MTRLWEKGEPLDARVLRYTAGEDHRLDERLVEYDVRASIAHARMLCERGLLEESDREQIEAALAEIAAEHARGEWQIRLEEEDAHTALEARLVLRLGETGERIHLGRSRNDQVLAALRLYLKDEAAALREGAISVAKALRALADRQGEIALPGYSHLQRAMPSSVALWATGFASEIEDDAEGLSGVLRRLDKNPLGSAAGYGVPHLPISRERTRELLGFAVTHEPVTAVQLSRGKAEAQLAFEIALLMQDLGRLSSDIVLFATHEFAFVKLSNDLTTGSSIMPQKRNPDLFELVRARSAQALAWLLEILSVPSKLPSGYHRDLQLIKPPLFRAIDCAHDTLILMCRALEGIRFRSENIRLDDDLFAAEEANRMAVAEGIPFREAYRAVARGMEKQSKRT